MNTDQWNALFLIMLFFLAAPPAAALLAEDIATEEIFARPRAWIEAHYPGGVLSYLVNCPACLSHWTMAAIVVLGTYQWLLIPYFAGLPVAFICWAAGTRLARRWLSDDL
jgi:hypothetical protein